MATAYGQALTVDLDQVQAMVDEMKVMTLHPDHEVLTSLLKCCAHATPPNPDLAVQWFTEFVPKAHLLAHVERALRQACGNDRADDVIAWAKTTCPQAAAPRRQHSSRRNDNRGNASRNGTNGGRNGNGGGSGRVAAQDSGDGIARKLQFEGEA
jgi:hypothetical protein